MSTELHSADLSHSLSQNPGTLANYLAASGVLLPEALPAFQKRTPHEPANLSQIGIDSAELLNLLLKLIYIDRLHTISQFASGIRLPPHLVTDLVRMATDRHLLHSTGSAGDQLASVRYALTEEGKRWALDALQQCRYAGPSPVTIDDYNRQIALQKLTDETVTHERIRASLSDLVVEDRVIEQSGPAMATSRAMLLYGTPGNGKTSIAVRFASVFKDIIFIPHAISIDGQIIRVFDPSMHEPVDMGESGSDDSAASFVRSRRYDTRWVPCRRPFIITGGELTLEMLELRYEPAANFYDAPIHVKALGGCLFIDDFGRQLLSPTHLLNRWIIPLESRMDFLRLQSGKTFRIPFEELLIFSTNLDPEDLMDPAFLRRLPYKIEISSPTTEQFRSILAMECEKLDLELTGPVFEQILHGITVKKGLNIAAYHPRFIVEQVAATCRFLGQPIHFNPRFIDNAIDNLRVRRPADRSHSFTHAHV